MSFKALLIFYTDLCRNLADEFITIDCKTLKVFQAPETLNVQLPQPVTGQVEFHQLTAVLEGRRLDGRDGVAAEVELAKVFEPTKKTRSNDGKSIISEAEVLNIVETIEKTTWNGKESVARKVDITQLAHVTKDRPVDNAQVTI